MSRTLIASHRRLTWIETYRTYQGGPTRSTAVAESWTSRSSQKFQKMIWLATLETIIFKILSKSRASGDAICSRISSWPLPWMERIQLPSSTRIQRSARLRNKVQCNCLKFKDIKSFRRHKEITVKPLSTKRSMDSSLKEWRRCQSCSVAVFHHCSIKTHDSKSFCHLNWLQLNSFWIKMCSRATWSNRIR